MAPNGLFGKSLRVVPHLTQYSRCRRRGNQGPLTPCGTATAAQTSLRRSQIDRAGSLRQSSVPQNAGPVRQISDIPDSGSGSARRFQLDPWTIKIWKHWYSSRSQAFPRWYGWGSVRQKGLFQTTEFDHRPASIDQSYIATYIGFTKVLYKGLNEQIYPD